MITNPKLLPNDIKEKLLAIRNALVREDINEAYHVLYSISDPSFSNYNPWDALYLISKRERGFEDH
jgi:hypothetical protein